MVCQGNVEHGGGVPSQRCSQNYSKLLRVEQASRPEASSTSEPRHNGSDFCDQQWPERPWRRRKRHSHLRSVREGRTCHAMKTTRASEDQALLWA